MAYLDRTLVQKPFHERPHLVILGAGATLAAFPNGDANGRKLPLMKDLAETCGIRSIINQHKIAYDTDDFEAFFSELVSSGQCPDAVGEIEEAIFEYFANMELPEEPTLYDHLVLSLRPKDVIATFNWDPFLRQALSRNHSFTEMPTPLFLHGNVAIGVCTRHMPITVSQRYGHCRRCGGMLEASRLLYPVAQKNYNSDIFTEKSWEVVQKVLEDAYLVTIFGYSAPATDVEAINLLKRGWGDSSQRSLEQFEIIDVKDEEELRATWDPFIHSHHYECTDDFYMSYIANHPRRTCDAQFDRLMNCVFLKKNPLPRYASWDELHKWLEPIIEDERKYAPAHQQD